MSFLERVIYVFLKHAGIGFERQKRFDFIGRKSLDFYLPRYNIAIECQGAQHYITNSEMFNCKKQKARDILKENECSSNGVTVLYYTEDKYKKIVPKRFKKNTYFNLFELERRIKHGI